MFEQPISEQIWDMKYRWKKHDGTILDHDVTYTWERIADYLSQAEEEDKRTYWFNKFNYAMQDFKFIPAGRIISGAGTQRRVTLSNCYTMGTIPDSMDGIFEMLKEAALTMQQGGGIGYDFSTIRPKGSHVKGVDADASGPLTFMDVWDAMCKTVMSAGSRRGAMMATMRCDHPDIEDFIEAKRDPNRLRMFNMSVMITDAFMDALRDDLDWDLVFNGKVYKTIKAKTLWDKIMISTYNYAEPGIAFIDRVNEMHNLNYMEEIFTCNPCGEKFMAPYSSCLLGSINLAKFVVNPFSDNCYLDLSSIQEIVSIAIRMMDNVIDMNNYPLEKQKEKALEDRQLGLGITGLADAMVMCGIKYGSEGSVSFVEDVMSLINDQAYITSAYLAYEKGSFGAFDKEKFLQSKFTGILSPITREAIYEYGIRNSLLTSIAPTGTISLYANNVSSGIEPIFAHSYERKILNDDGSHRIEKVSDYAVYLYNKMFPGKPLPDTFVTAQDITPREHIVVQAAAQKYVDSSISKTTNCPEDISFNEFKDVYMYAYLHGCKGCTTYRPNDITGSILTVKDDKKEDDSAACEIKIDPDTGQMIRTCDQ